VSLDAQYRSWRHNSGDPQLPMHNANGIFPLAWQVPNQVVLNPMICILARLTFHETSCSGDSLCGLNHKPQEVEYEDCHVVVDLRKLFWNWMINFMNSFSWRVSCFLLFFNFLIIAILEYRQFQIHCSDTTVASRWSSPSFSHSCRWAWVLSLLNPAILSKFQSLGSSQASQSGTSVTVQKACKLFVPDSL